MNTEDEITHCDAAAAAFYAKHNILASANDKQALSDCILGERGLARLSAQTFEDTKLNINLNTGQPLYPKSVLDVDERVATLQLRLYDEKADHALTLALLQATQKITDRRQGALAEANQSINNMSDTIGGLERTLAELDVRIKACEGLAGKLTAVAAVCANPDGVTAAGSWGVSHQIAKLLEEP